MGETLVSADKLLGMTIRNIGTSGETSQESANGKNEAAPKGEDIGEVGDIVLEPGDNRIAYVVLEYGGILGVGEKLIAVPWEAFEVPSAFDGLGSQDSSQGAVALYINVPKDRLENAKGIDTDHYPESADPAFMSGTSGARMHKTSAAGRGEKTSELGATPQPETNQPAEGAKSDWQRRLSSLIGTDIKGSDNTSIGELKDAIIDTREGRAVYGIVSYGGTVGLFTDTAAVPWEAIDIRPSDKVLALNATEPDLAGVMLAKGDYRALEQEDFSRKVHDAFGQEPYWYVYGYVAPGPTEEAPQGPESKPEQDQPEQEGPSQQQKDPYQPGQGVPGGK